MNYSIIASIFLSFTVPVVTFAQETWDTRKEVSYKIKFERNQLKSRSGNFKFYAPDGLRICYATTNEWSANPKGIPHGGKTEYRITERTPTSFNVSVTLPCGGGGIPGILTTTASVVAILTVPDRAPGIAGAVNELEKKEASCGIAGEHSWLDLEYVAVVVPTGSQCPELCGGQSCSHPIPWQDFPSP